MSLAKGRLEGRSRGWNTFFAAQLSEILALLVRALLRRLARNASRLGSNISSSVLRARVGGIILLSHPHTRNASSHRPIDASARMEMLFMRSAHFLYQHCARSSRP